jgi:hypothetical protein
MPRFDGIHSPISFDDDAVKALLIETLRVTESALFWAAVLLGAVVVGFSLALRQRSGRSSSRKSGRSHFFPRLHAFRCP